MAMLFHSSPPMMTLHGRHENLELYPDRIIIRSTRWLARRFPLLFATARMLYLDEVIDLSLCPVRFWPDFHFKLIIESHFLADVRIECLEKDYVAANRIIDYIEDYLSQGAFLPPANV